MTQSGLSLIGLSDGLSLPVAANTNTKTGIIREGGPRAEWLKSGMKVRYHMRYVAIGRALPERANIGFGEFTLGDSEKGRITAQCDASQLTILLDRPEIDDLTTAHLAAEHFAQIVVCSLGFSLGSGYSVEIIQVTEEDGTPHVFGVRHEELKFDPHIPVFNRALNLSFQDLFFRLALRDYTRAITDALDCATHCYRAIEAIKSAFVFKTGKNRWDDMHAALGTNRAIIESTVKKFADPVRHGNWVATKETDSHTRPAMLSLTRDMLAKYLDYVRPET